MPLALCLIAQRRNSHCCETIPRHLRDIVITEYGVADLRGKSDADVIAAMLSVADSRFQPELLRQAKDAGKIAKHFEIDRSYRENLPDKIDAALAPARESGFLPAFPFGSDFNAIEQRLIPALQVLNSAASSPQHIATLFWRGLTRKPCAADEACLARLGLDRPTTLTERIYRVLVSGALMS